MFFRPLVLNAQIEPSSLGTDSSKSGNSNLPIATKSTSEHNIILTRGLATGVQFLGQTYTRALQLPAVQIARLEHTILFHHRDPSAFAFAKEEVQSVNSRIKVLTQRQPLYQQQHLLQQPQMAQTSPSPFPSASSNSLNSSLSSQASSSASMNKVISGFDGLTQSQAGFNGLTYFPPDVPLAVGPNYVVQVVNLAGEIFTKQGVSVSRFALPTFFKVSSINDRLSDPRIFYDSISGRWFASLGDGTTDDVRVAVSTTNDPTGSWNIYRFGVSDCPDEPGIGVNNDKFAISTNLFSSSCDGVFMGVEYYIVDKGDLVNGITAPRFVQNVPDTSVFSVYPIQSLSSSSTLYMVSVGDDQSNSITLYSFTGTVPNNNVALSVLSLPIQTTHIPPGALQTGTTTRLDTGDARVEDAVWYQGKIWLAFNDACTPSGDTQSRACIRLDQIDTNANKVLQDFDKGDIGVYYFYPGLQIDGSGNLDFIYGYSSTSTYPSLAASGQAVGSALNTLIQPIILKLGSADDLSGRYGDYFEAAVDPSNTNVIWVAGEYHSSPGWSTFISAVNQQPGRTPPSLHATSLTLKGLTTSVPWRIAIRFTGKLTDNNASDIGIGGKTITFTGTGSANIANAVTNTDGTFTAKGIAPDTVATGWTVQAHFAGDRLYNSKDSNIAAYSTIKHTNSLSLIISPTSVTPLGIFSLSGTLIDTTSSKPLEGRTITFTATSPITVGSRVTNSLGQYSATGVIAPNTTATYSIQAHFAGDPLYNLVDSAMKTITVTNSAGSTAPPHLPPFPHLPPINSSPLENLSRYLSSHIYQQTQALLLYLQHLKLQEQQEVQRQLQQYLQLQRYQSHISNSAVANRSSSEPGSSLLSIQQQGQQSIHPYTQPSLQDQQRGKQQNPLYQYPFSYQSRLPSLWSNQNSPYYPYQLQQKNQSQGQRLQNQHINQQPPIANAGVPRTVYGATIVTLNGGASYDPDNYVTSSGYSNIINNGIVAYQWTQIQFPSNPGVQTPVVILQGANTATPTFVAPILPYDTMLAFSLRVMDSDGGALSTNPAIVYVTVKHNPGLNNNPQFGAGNAAPGNTINQPQQQHEQSITPPINAIGGPLHRAFPLLPPPQVRSPSAPNSISFPSSAL